MSELARSTFGIGGPAAVMVQLMLIAVVGWLLATIAQAARQGKIANFINIATIFTCIYMVTQTIWKTIKAVGGIAGF